MVLLDYLLAELIKAGVKAYRASQEKKRELATGTPDQAVSVPRRAAAPRAASGSRDRVDRLAADARAFAAGPTVDPAQQALHQVVTDVIAPFADEAQRAAGLEDADRLRGRTRFHRRLLDALEQLREQRDDAQRSAILEDVDVVARACYEPLLDFQRRRGFPLSTSRPVAFFGESAGSLTALFARTPVAPIEVSVRIQHDVIGWPLIAREVGRDIVISVDGLREQLRGAAGFPQPKPNLPSGYVTEDDVLAALGAWQVELCADGIGALLLGPAYLAALSSLIRSPDQPYRTRVVGGVRQPHQPPPPRRAEDQERHRGPHPHRLRGRRG